MDELTFLCAHQLIDDLMNLSSSSDDDDEMLAFLEYANQQEAIENFKGNKINIAKSTKNYQENNLDAEVNNSDLERGVSHLNERNVTSAEFTKTDDRAEETLREKIVRNSLYESDFKVNLNSCPESNEKDADKELTSIFSLNIETGEENPFDESITDSLTPNEFKKHFHISRESATYLMEKFSLWHCKSSFEESGQKAAIKTTMLSFLWFCANPVSFKSVARIFNASIEDTKQFFNIILKFFEQELAAETIKYPNSYIDKEVIAKEFEKIAGFPNVLGCLAESYFSLKVQKLVYKLGGSQVYLRGICDSNRKFLNVKIGFPKEKNNDSFLDKDLPKLCFPKYHLLGDLKYPIRDHLITPFGNTDALNEAEKHFNIKLYRTHVKIKNAFGMLRSRFQQFKYLDFDDYETLSNFIVVCCILHNICIDRQDFYDDQIRTDVSDRLFRCSLASAKNDDFLTDLGVMKRFELTQILFRAK